MRSRRPSTFVQREVLRVALRRLPCGDNRGLAAQVGAFAASRPTVAEWGVYALEVREATDVADAGAHRTLPCAVFPGGRGSWRGPSPGMAEHAHWLTGPESSPARSAGIDHATLAWHVSTSP